MPLTSEGKFLLFLSNFSLLEFGTDFAMVSVRTSEADVGCVLPISCADGLELGLSKALE